MVNQSSEVTHKEKEQMTYFRGTKGKWFHEPEPTFNEAANAYQIAILQEEEGKGDVVPAFAFGRTKEKCMHNAKVVAASTELLDRLVEMVDLAEQEGLKDSPTVRNAIHAINKALGA